MRIKKTVLPIIKENVRLKNRIALELDKAVYTVERWIADNNDNLTKAAALKVIKEETGLSDAEILEEETIGA